MNQWQGILLAKVLPKSRPSQSRSLAKAVDQGDLLEQLDSAYRFSLRLGASDAVHLASPSAQRLKDDMCHWLLDLPTSDGRMVPEIGARSMADDI